MQDPTSALFQLALGIAPPWQVDRLDFDPDPHRLDIHIGFQRGPHFPRPEGDSADCPVHDTADKKWRHLNFFQHEAYLHARVRRVRCEEHRVHQVAVPWAREGSGITLLFEALAMLLMREMPVKVPTRIVSEQDTRLWRRLLHYVEVARAQVSSLRAMARLTSPAPLGSGSDPIAAS